MVLKLIFCTVPESKKPAFTLAQAQWASIQGTEGFVAQFGGWNQANNQEAIILGIWKSWDFLEAFMDEGHDDIFDKSNQEKTYSSIHIEHYQVRSKIDWTLFAGDGELSLDLHQNATSYLKGGGTSHLQVPMLKSAGLKRRRWASSQTVSDAMTHQVIDIRKQPEWDVFT